MKKTIILLLLLIGGSSVINKARAQADEIAQLVLDIEKLAQFKGILTDLKKGYQILSNGYGAVKNVSEGNFNIHKIFLDGLMQVSPTVKKYYKVPVIIEDQLSLISEYKSALKRFGQQGNFTASELKYIAGVYENLFNESLQNLEELINVVTANKLRMSDDERFKAIDRIHADMQDKLFFLRDFNGSTSLLSLEREKEKANIGTQLRLYGLKNND